RRQEYATLNTSYQRQMGKENTVANQSYPSRRQILSGVVAGLAGAALPHVARAKAPMANTPAPAFYRFKLGGFEATIVSDGPVHLGAPSSDVLVGVSKEQMTKELADNFLPTDDVLIEQNALVVNTGDRVVLFDTGGFKMMGPDAGHLTTNLRAS